MARTSFETARVAVDVASARPRTAAATSLPLRLPVPEIVGWLRQHAGGNWLESFLDDPRRGWLFCPNGEDLHPVKGRDMLIIAKAMGGWPVNPLAQPIFFEVAA